MTRVGLVGFGGAGAGFHAPLLQAAGLTVTSVVTRNPERIERAARDVPNAHVLPDVDALLRRAEAEALDLIVLASPSGLHVEQADRKSTRLNSSHRALSRMPSSA